jgi:hypothetical protein
LFFFFFGTLQADKRETIAAIKQEGDGTDKKVRGDVKQLERDIKDERLERKKNAKLRNDLNDTLQTETCKLSKLVQEFKGETEQKLISVKRILTN